MDFNYFIVTKELSILEVMNVINNNGRGIAFICEDGKLLGVVTDGDIRRYILKKGDLKESVHVITNYNPIFSTSKNVVQCNKIMLDKCIKAMPVVDSNNRILSIQLLYSNPIHKNENLNIPVVIMAGGKGSRLYPYTQILPKPLIPIGDKTITEHIMDRFESFGCNDFTMIVNYKKNLIKAFFMDSECNRNVEFVEEKEYLGTGGGLKLLKNMVSGTFFMSNCDVLIQEDYSNIIEYHKKEKNIITIVSAMKNVTIPYGTIETDEEGRATKLTEKPSYSFLTNTGLYIIEPRFLELIPEHTFIHITDVISNCINSNEKVGVYPISESSWMDMGQIEELEAMKKAIEGY